VQLPAGSTPAPRFIGGERMVDREKLMTTLQYRINEARNKGSKVTTIFISTLSDCMTLLKEQQNQIWEMQDRTEYLEDKLKEQEAIIEQYHKADTFLEAHGWKWEGR